MGLLDGLFNGRGSSTHTTTTSPQYPGWYNNILTQFQNDDNSYLNNPSIPVTPLNANQKKVGSTFAQLLKDLPSHDLSSSVLASMGDLPQAQDLSGKALGMMGKYTPNAIREYANAYADDMIGQQLGDLDEAVKQRQSNIGQRAAAAGAFGGTREAVERAQLNRDALDTAADISTKTRYDSYSQGANNLLQSLGIDLNALNSAESMQNNNFMRGVQGRASDLQMYQGADDLYNANFGRTNIAAAGLGQYGDKQYGITDAKNMAPYNDMARTVGLLSGVPMSQTTTQPVYNNSSNGLMGLGMMALGGGFF